MSLDREMYNGEDEDVPEEERSPNSLDVYVYIWTRFRMIAKDFILQNYRFGGRLDEYCIECHERMVRWHIMSDHQLQWSGEFSLIRLRLNYYSFCRRFQDWSCLHKH